MAFYLGGRQDPRLYDGARTAERQARIAPFGRAATRAAGTAASATLGGSAAVNPMLASRNAGRASAAAAAPIMQRQAEVEQAVYAEQAQQIRAEREAERQRAERMLGVGLQAAGAVGGTLLQALPPLFGGGPQSPGNPPPAAPVPQTAPAPAAPAPAAPAPAAPVPVPAAPPGVLTGAGEVLVPGRPPPQLTSADVPATMSVVDQTMGLTPPAAPAVPPRMASTIRSGLSFVPETQSPAAAEAGRILEGFDATSIDRMAVPGPATTAPLPSAAELAAPVPQAAPPMPAQQAGPTIGGVIQTAAPALSAIPAAGPLLSLGAGIFGGLLNDEEERRRRGGG